MEGGRGEEGAVRFKVQSTSLSNMPVVCQVTLEVMSRPGAKRPSTAAGLCGFIFHSTTQMVGQICTKASYAKPVALVL